jgi:hypothetical protein
VTGLDDSWYTVPEVNYSDPHDPLQKLYELGEVVAARLDGHELRWCDRHGIVIGLYQDITECPMTGLACQGPYPLVDENLKHNDLKRIYEGVQKWSERLVTDHE